MACCTKHHREGDIVLGKPVWILEAMYSVGAKAIVGFAILLCHIWECCLDLFNR